MTAQQDGDGDGDELGDGEFLAGRLLIAMPGIGDPRFERAVILMCAHSADNAMGVAVNNPVEGLSLSDLLERLGVKSRDDLVARPVLAGGPVERERGFVIHTDDFATADATLPVISGIALTPTREVLEAMADADAPPAPVHPGARLRHLGREGQLEQEIGFARASGCPATLDTPDEGIAGVRRRPRQQVGPRPGQDRRLDRRPIVDAGGAGVSGFISPIAMGE